MSLCDLGVAASRAGKGHLLNPERPLVANTTRTFVIEEALVGPVGTLDFRAEQSFALRGYDGGAMVLVTWTTLSGVSDVWGNGLFWEFAPGVYENDGQYGGELLFDGGAVGGVSECCEARWLMAPRTG